MDNTHLAREDGSITLTNTDSAPDNQRLRLCYLATLLVLFGSLGGCQLLEPATGGENLSDLESELESLETLVVATREDLAILNTQQSSGLDALNKRLEDIDGGVKQVPELITNACERPEVLPTICDDSVKTIVNQDDKMILGQLEHLWVSPPGLHLIARIDTGTVGNSIHASDVTPFERDGDNWVRFVLGDHKSSRSDEESPEDIEPVVVEKKIERRLRVSKRPVVRLRVRLGNVLDSFDFILSDRSGDAQPVLLGRNFLQDIALVDVSSQFVQPQVQPANIARNPL